MKKALLATTALIVGASPALAQKETSTRAVTRDTQRVDTRPAPQPQQTYTQTAPKKEPMFSPLSSLYVGGYGGYSYGGDIDTPAGIDDVEIDGGDYGLFVGMKADTLLDRTVNRFGVGLNGGLEFHYGWSDADGEEDGVDFDKNDEWGVTFRPGLSFLDNLSPFSANPYGIIGYRWAEYEVSADGDSDDEGFDGFTLGAGTEVLAYENVGVRFDYTHTWYEDKDNFQPTGHDFRLGLAYHF